MAKLEIIWGIDIDQILTDANTEDLISKFVNREVDLSSLFTHIDQSIQLSPQTKTLISDIIRDMLVLDHTQRITIQEAIDRFSALQLRDLYHVELAGHLDRGEEIPHVVRDDGLKSEPALKQKAPAHRLSMFTSSATPPSPIEDTCRVCVIL